MESKNMNVNNNFANGENSVKGNEENIAPDVKFINEPLQENVIQKKRKRKEDSDAKQKVLAEEEYNREVHEHRYKRLMHLLKRSKFYASYIINKINKSSDSDTTKIKKKVGRKKVEVVNKNASMQVTKKRKIAAEQNYDIREYIPEDVQEKLNMSGKKLNLSAEEIESELVKESDDDDNKPVVFVTPKYFVGNLRNYQHEGLQWLKVLYENGLNGILADEMGLGKTIQVIALFCHLIDKKQDGPYLIVAPLSTIPNWMLEFEKFAPTLPVVVFHGPEKTRTPLKEKIKQKHYITETYRTQPVVLTSYEIPIFEEKFMKSQNWRYVVVDEGHRIKNHNTVLAKILRQFKSMNRLLLTGTPLQNNLAELWSLLNFLLPEIFNDLAVFESWFDAKELQNDEGTKKFLQQEEEKHVLLSLREILKPFMLRREKSDVCLDIPSKKEVIVYTPITELQHDLYKAVLNRDLEVLSKIDESPLIIQNEDGSRPKRRCVLNNVNPYRNDYIQEEDDEIIENSAPKISIEQKHLIQWKKYTDVTDRNHDFLIRIKMGSKIMMYKKIINHPYLVHCPLNDAGLPKIDENLVKSSGKLLVLDAMLKKLHSQGHKILLFSTMTMILDLIEEYLSLRTYNYVRLDGNTSLEDRKENIKKFNENSDIFLFLISTRAGGVGLNLAAADTVILYDSDWNPQADLQAMARCHRIGQVRPVVIYRLCTKGTVDEIIINRADTKRILEKMVISKELKLALQKKETLLELKKLLESKEGVIFASQNEVFTEAELNKLTDRSELM